MHQTTLGLDNLHGLEGGFIHRNIHGRNVLIAEIPSSSDTHYVVKLSDFRFGKPALKDAQNSLTKSSSGWIAPEMNDPNAMLGPWTDVFILGCFFYYVLSGGDHPFGRNVDQPNRETNICDRQYKPNWTRYTTDDNKAMIENYLELIEHMTSFNANERPKTGQILRHFDTKNYYNIYPVIGPSSSTDGKTTGATLRPGLCLIFHQDQFYNVSQII
jgi:serine/threonine-protein kinase/endoribonuclease IRE1